MGMVKGRHAIQEISPYDFFVLFFFLKDNSRSFAHASLRFYFLPGAGPTFRCVFAII